MWLHCVWMRCMWMLSVDNILMQMRGEFIGGPGAESAREHCCSVLLAIVMAGLAMSKPFSFMYDV